LIGVQFHVNDIKLNKHEEYTFDELLKMCQNACRIDNSEVGNKEALDVWRLAKGVIPLGGSELVEAWKACGAWRSEVPAKQPRARVCLVTWYVASGGFGC